MRRTNKNTLSLDSMLDARQLVSGSQTRLAHCWGQSSPKRSGPLPCRSPCAAALSHLCARSTAICRERVCCSFLKDIHPSAEGDCLVPVIFSGQRPQGGYIYYFIRTSGYKQKNKVFAIYQIMLGWKTYTYYYETDELPNPSKANPTQEK